MTVTIPGDFDLQKIAASGQAFRIAQTPQGWRFLAGDKLLYLQPGSGDTYTASCTPEEWQGFWHRYFDLNRNYAAIRAAVPKQDAYLCAAARAGAGIRILRQDAWEMLVTFIISQRKNIPAIQACVETLCTRYGAPLLQPGGNVLYAFPTAQALAAAGEQALRDCALGYRAPYVLAAAQAVAAGALDLAALETLPDARLLRLGILPMRCIMLASGCSAFPTTTAMIKALAALPLRWHTGRLCRMMWCPWGFIIWKPMMTMCTRQ